ncbi:hypothetical protein PR048_032694 [Dryococelus australis]|uniref:HAT C-terminal dimerisation domain-containing protein n=1 Tax=Dryococelus australis TaxID=614101 RepID=A0ABQ9G638_9NEOP|nr:hypothetical protein PR048_032694 [Dryococelus australis]
MEKKEGKGDEEGEIVEQEIVEDFSNESLEMKSGAISFTNSSTLVPESSDLCSPVVSRAARTSSLRSISDISGPSNAEKQGATNDIEVVKILEGNLLGFVKHSVLQFCTALPVIAAALEWVSMWKDSASASKAKFLLSAISDSDIIVAVVSLSDLFITTLQPSRTLHKKTLDLNTAEEMLRDTITTLKAKRELGTELKVQRIAKKQVHRCNTPAPDLVVFFWQTVKSDEEDSNQKTVIELLSECDRDVFPVINILLQVLATLPVSVATAERTFSTLKRLKTWLRTTMNEDRLIGLAPLATHHDITINPDQVIDRFTMSRNRTILYELHAPLMVLLSRSTKVSKQQLEEVMRCLDEASIILSFEPPGTPEGDMGSAACDALAHLRKSTSKT